jgi:hypothetical protein
MKNFVLKHPFSVSLLIFFTVFIGGGIISSIIFGFLIGGNCHHFIGPNPCKGNLASAILLGILGFLESLILGIFVSISTFKKIKTKKEQSYK